MATVLFEEDQRLAGLSRVAASNGFRSRFVQSGVNNNLLNFQVPLKIPN